MQNPELVDRAIAHLSATLPREQATREEIAFLAVNYLRDDPPAADMKGAPSDDWLNLFSSLASRAISQPMKEHWAQILKGEIRSPGSFSLSTLQVMSVLDKSLAETVVRVWPAVIVGMYVATIGRFNEGAFYTDLITLDSLGLIRLSYAMFFIADDRGEGFLWAGSKALIFRGLPAGQRCRLTVGVLSQSGRELASIVPFGGNEEIVRELGPLILNEFRAKAVFLSDYDQSTKSPSGPHASPHLREPEGFVEDPVFIYEFLVFDEERPQSLLGMVGMRS